MADPTLSDVMTALQRLDREQQQQTLLLAALTEGLQLMSQPVNDTKAAVDALTGKVDTFITAATTALSNLQAQLTAAQQAIASGDPSPADVATLQATLTEAQGESTKIDTAIAALSPVAPATTPTVTPTV